MYWAKIDSVQCGKLITKDKMYWAKIDSVE